MADDDSSADGGYDDSYWAELKWEQEQEEFYEDCWERTMQLIGECSDYDPLVHHRPLLGHLIDAWDYLGRDLIHNPTNKTYRQIDKNLTRLAEQAREEMDDELQQQQQEPIYF